MPYEVENCYSLSDEKYFLKHGYLNICCCALKVCSKKKCHNFENISWHLVRLATFDSAWILNTLTKFILQRLENNENIKAAQTECAFWLLKACVTYLLNIHGRLGNLNWN